MRTTVSIDDVLYQRTLELSDLRMDKADVLREAIRTYVRVQTGKRLSTRGGSGPSMQDSARTRAPNHHSKGVEDESSFYSLGTEFLEAARVLMNTPPTKVGYQSVTYYLLGHAAELFLKAFLYTKGMSTAKMKAKGNGHSLIALLDLAHALGLPDQLTLTSIRAIGTLYASKALEYRDQSAQSYPFAEDLFAEVKRLSALAFDAASEPFFNHQEPAP